MRDGKQHGIQFFVQLYTVSEVVGSFLDEIKDEGGTIHFCGALDKVTHSMPNHHVNIYHQEWKSCLETITPDSPYMLLENGEYATLPENLNFIFEVDDLENGLPENIVEQVGVNHDPSNLLHRKEEVHKSNFSETCSTI